MKNKYFINTFLLFFLFQFSIFAAPVRKKIGSYNVSLNGTKENINHLLKKDDSKFLNNLLINIDLFNQEIGRLNSFKVSTIDIMVKDKTDQNLEIDAYIKEKKMKYHKKIFFSDIKSNSEGKIISFSFKESDSEEKVGDYYQIFNTSYDSNNNLVKRLIIKNKEVTGQDNLSGYKEFIHGKFVEYASYSKSYFPGSLKIRRFILNSLGDILVVNIKESSDREYNNKGFLTKERLKETSYPFSKATPFLIYNLKLNKNQNVEFFEVLFSGDKQNQFYAKKQSYEVFIEKYVKDQYALKTVVEFEKQGNEKIYLKGRKVVRKFSGSKVIRIDEQFFDVKDKMSGRQENERIYKFARETYNLSFDKNGKTLNSNIIDRTFLYQKNDVMPVNLFRSLKKVKYNYQSSNMVKALVDFFAYDKKKQLIKLRSLEMNVLEFDKTGKPLKLDLKTKTPLAPQNDVTNNFDKNITYVIQDAIYGFNYFFLIKTDFIAELRKVSDRGEIEDVSFIDK